MKFKYSPVFFGLLTLALFSCQSENDEYGLAIPKENVVNFFPLKIDNTWKYENKQEVNGEYIERTEELRISDSIMIYETPSYFFSSDLTLNKKGNFTKLLSSGFLNKVEGKLIYSGDFIIHFPMIEDSIQIPLENILLLHQSRSLGQTLSVQEGDLFQKLQFEETEIPVNLRYQVRTVQGSAGSNTNIPEDFEETISSKIILNLKATYETADGNPIEILSEQEVLDITLHFAKEVGVFRSNSIFKMEFTNLEQLNINPVPPYEKWSSQKLINLKIK